MLNPWVFFSNNSLHSTCTGNIYIDFINHKTYFKSIKNQLYKSIELKKIVKL